MINSFKIAFLFLIVFMFSLSACQQKEVKFELGVASYSFRKFSTDEAIAFTKQLGIDHIAFKSFHLKLDASDSEIAEVVKKCQDAGIDLYAGGVIYMKTKQEVDQAFEYARKAGMRMIICVPNHDLLSYVESKVKEYDLKVAIHNHGPGDKLYPSVETAYELIKNRDSRMGICIDIGHTTRIGRNPADDFKRFGDRIFEVHLKDVTSTDADGRDCIIGSGVIDFNAFFSELIKQEYAGILSLEYEKDEDNPVLGMAESLGYVHGVLDMLHK